MKALHISDFEAHMKRMHNKNAHAAKKTLTVKAFIHMAQNPI